MKKSGDTLQRQWQLLRLLPRYPQKTTAGELQQRLAGEGFRTVKRSVERDLQALSGIFPIVADVREKPYGWSWDRNAPILDVPSLTATQALTFALVQRFLAPLMPASLLREIDPYFKIATAQLAALPKERGLPSWMEKVRVVPPTQPLLPPRIKADVQKAVYEALLDSRQMQITYHKRGAKGPVEYTVHPLGIVQRGPITYLVCCLFDYQNVLLLALHRILSAVLLDEQAKFPPGFRLDDYLATGALNFGDGKRVRLEAIFGEEAAEHLHETPLSEDQKISAAGKGRSRVAATVLDTPQLFWWLLAFGDQVEVIRPKALRSEILNTAKAMVRRYRDR